MIGVLCVGIALAAALWSNHQDRKEGGPADAPTWILGGTFWYSLLVMLFVLTIAVRAQSIKDPCEDAPNTYYWLMWGCWW